MSDDLEDRVVRVVDAQTSPMQPDLVSVGVVTRILRQPPTDVSIEEIREAIRDAVADGCLVEEDGRYRLAE